VLAAAAALAAGAPSAPAAPPPEGGFASPSGGEPCKASPYPECRRLHFTYGPLAISPGANYNLIGPVTIEKPAYAGYMVRFAPDMVRADGRPPPTEEVMLHHATWVNTAKSGLTSPFAASGEEKSILTAPRGYGYLVDPTDTWQLNYMIHNATPRSETVWLTYDVDFVPRDAGAAHGIRNVVPLWLDVLRDSDRPTYPVFNVQRGYGHVNRATGRRECAYPRERCAAFDPYGADQPGNGRGWDFTVPSGLAGSLVSAVGHVHPGGLRTDLSVVRGARQRHVFISRAVYHDPGGPLSWDLSMTATKPSWRVRVRAGDRLRVNATYESERASWYEGMGIVVAWIAPGDASGVDPFARVRVRRRVAPARRGRARRRARYRWVWKPAPIPIDGAVTHGHLAENDNHGGRLARPLPDRVGGDVDSIGIANFHFSAGDLSDVQTNGIPRVKENSGVTFYNFDAAATIWHTITTCRLPCTGTTGVSYPLADTTPALDSLVLGFAPTGVAIQPAANRGDFTIAPARDGLKPGTYTYFCRVHPFMRGAFKVVP
jgi:hypothetical protein